MTEAAPGLSQLQQADRNTLGWPASRWMAKAWAKSASASSARPVRPATIPSVVSVSVSRLPPPSRCIVMYNAAYDSGLGGRSW